MTGRARHQVHDVDWRVGIDNQLPLAHAIAEFAVEVEAADLKFGSGQRSGLSAAE